MNINNGRKLTYIVIANLLSVSILNLAMNLLSSQPAPIASILSMPIFMVALSFGLIKGIAWTRLVTGILAAIYASSSLFYGLNILASTPAMAIIYIFMGVIFLITALILFGAQSVRDFIKSQQKIS